MARRARAFRGFVPGMQPLEGRRLMTADVQLSRLAWVTATNGRGPVELDRNAGGGGAGDGGVIVLDGVAYSQGLGAYANSEIQYALAGRYGRFRAVIGVDDVANGAGSVVFQVWADGAKLYDSGLVTRASAAIPIDLDVSGRANLRLVVTDGGNGNTSDFADWADARLVSPAALDGGGFATPHLAAGAYANAPAGSPWTFSAASGLDGSGLAADGSAMTLGNPAAPSGGQAAFVRGAGSISQATANLHAGRYTVAFKAAQRSPSSAAQDFKVTLDGVELGRFTPSGASYGSYATATFDVAAGVHVLAFVGLNSAGGDATALLDDVAMTRIDAAASFASTDATTKGDWKGAYGSGGYSLAGDATSLPAYASVAVSGASVHVWTTNTKDVRALQKASTGRIASVWNGDPQFTIDVDINDGRSHRVSLHALDWSTFDRRQRIDVLDAGTGALLDSRLLSDFNGGVYSTWDLQGQVRFRIVFLNGNNAVVSGIFFAAAEPPDRPTGVAASATSPTSTLVTWAAASGAESYAVERSLDREAWTAAGSAGAGAASFADAALSDDARYYYRVTAVNSAGSSTPSAVASATTPLAAPTGVAAEFFASDRIDVSWTDVSVAEGGYVVEQSADGVGGWTAVAAAPAGAARAVASGPFSPSTPYYFRVLAYSNATGSTSSYSATASATTPAIAAPSGLSASWSSRSQAVFLAWADNSSDETGFIVERSTDGSTWISSGTPPPDQTSLMVQGLPQGVTYQFRVRARNGSGESANSNVAVVRVGSIPAAPINLTAVPAGPGRINLAWTDAATNETGYRIERSTDGVNFSLLTTLVANQTTTGESDLAPGTTYYFRARAENAEDSAWSNVVSATTTTQPPAAPLNLTAVPGSPTLINLAWTGVAPDESGYKVERSTDGVDFAVIATPAAGVTTAAVGGLTPGVVYHFRVRAYNGDDSAYSNVASASPAQVLPDPPVNLRASVLSNVLVNLSWIDDTDNEDQYRVEYSTDGVAFTTAGFATASWTGVGLFEATNLTPGTTYWFRVVAANAAGDSPPAVVVATTAGQPVAPTAPAAAALSPTEVRITWGDVARETGYEIERLVGSTWTRVGTTGPDATAFVDSGLTERTTYSYRIRAANGAGDSAYTGTVSATTDLLGPASLAATSASGSRIDLSWTDRSAVETGYQVEWSSDGVAWTTTDPSPENATTASIAGSFAPGTTYHFRVRAVQSPYLHVYFYSAYASATKTTGFPAAPTGVSVGSPTGSSLQVTWAAVAGASGYRVERSPDGTTAWTQVATPLAGTTSHVDTGLTDGKRYSYRVTAYNAGGDSAPSAPANAATSVAAPTGLTAAALSGGRVDLTWTDASTAETAYYLERSTNGVSWSALPSRPADSATYSDLADFDGSLTYQYRVRAYSTVAGYSTYSNVASVATSAFPSKPAAPTTTPGVEGAIALTWAAVAGATGYRVERSPTGTSGWSQVGAPTSSTSLTDSGLPEGTRYYYRVTAYNTAGDSAPGAANAATAVTAPTGLTAAVVSRARVDLTWADRSAVESGYAVERSPDGETGWIQVGTAGVNSTSYSVAGPFDPGTSYFFRVRVYNGLQSAYSPALVVDTSLPLPPTGLVAVAASETAIVLTWNDAAGEAGYVIERSTGGWSDWAQVGTVAANQTSFSDIGLAEGTTRYYRVRSTLADFNAESSASDLGLATTLPARPTGLTATATDGGGILLDWQDNSGVEDGFVIERWVDGAYQVVLTVGPGVTDAAIVGRFEASSTQRFIVRAFVTDPLTGEQRSLASNEAQTTPGTWPEAPTALTAVAVSDAGIDLAWTDNADDETGYDVERSVNGVTWTWIALAPAGEGGTASYADRALTGGEGSVYSYRVRATKIGSPNSAYSNVAKADTLPVAPANLAASIVDGGRVDLTWVDASNIETAYVIEQLIDGGWWEVERADAGSQAATVAGIYDPALQYTFRVVGYTYTDTGGMYSASSNTATATASAWPKAPTELTVAAVSNTRIDVSWTDNASNETFYQIDRSTDGETWVVLTAALSPNTHIYSDTGLADGTVYVYRVRAVNGAGGSAYSLNAAATLPTAPMNLQATVVSGTEIDLSWAASAYATGYNIWMLAYGSEAWTLVASVPASQTAYAVTGLTPGGAHYVFAVAPTNSTAPSAIAFLDSATPYASTPNAPPVITSVAAGQAPVTGTSATLNVVASDDRGEGGLTYSWSLVAGPDSASFGVNDGNDAKYTTVFFTEPGDYTFRVTVTDGPGLSVSYDVNVTVEQTLTSIAITPGDATIVQGTKRRLTATALDQFGDELENQPTFAWQAVGGAGTIDSSGLYSAPFGGDGWTSTINAYSGGNAGTASITVITGSGVYVQAVDGTQVKVYTMSGELKGTLPWNGPFPSGLTFRGPDNIYLDDGSYLDASQRTLVRRNSGGAVIQTYISGHAPPWTGMVLDPDGKTFWACDYSCYVYKFDIYTGAKHLDYWASGVLAKIGVLDDPLLELTVADHGAPASNAVTIATDESVDDLYISEDRLTGTAKIDVSALIDQNDFETRKKVRLRITRADHQILVDSDFANGGVKRGIPLRLTPEARDFQVLVWLDLDDDGEHDASEDYREVYVHVIGLGVDFDGDGTLTASDRKISTIRPTALDLEGNAPVGKSARTRFEIKVGGPKGAGHGHRIVVPNVPGLMFWTDATGGTRLTPNADGDIISEILDGAFYRTIWVSAAVSTTLSATEVPIGPNGDARVRLLLRDRDGRDVARSSIGVNKPVQVLYAVDGTKSKAADRANVYRFMESYSGVAGIDKHYFDGPQNYYSGADSRDIAIAVESRIKADYFTATSRYRKLVIDLLGWSRGGVIVATVAQELAHVEMTPTDYRYLVENAEGNGSITVHWIGMFDAVNQIGRYVKAPHGNWAAVLSNNVASSVHLTKSKKATLLDKEINKTVVSLGTLEYLPDDPARLAGHYYIGQQQEALLWMIRRAASRRVPVE